MNVPHSIPFTEDGLIEATNSRVAAKPVAEVWPQVLAGIQGLSDAERATALTTTYLVKPPAAYQPGFHIDGQRRVVAIQGGWWYRGVTCVEPHPDGSRVTHVVVNVAPGWGKWLAHFVQARSHRKTVQADRAG